MPDVIATAEAAVALLERDGFLRREGERLRTTARWQAALARAALGLQRARAPWRDLRLPIAAAVAEQYGALSDQELAILVEAMLPVEERELAPMLASFDVAQR